MVHAALVVVVGWYALVPPAADLQAPLAKWDHFRSFDTAKECEEMMIEYVRKLPRNDWYKQAERVRCIDSADRRLL